MSKQPETKFKEKVLKELAKIPKTWWVKAQMVAVRGIPDLLICCNGKFVVWELKMPGNKATKLQEHNLELARNAGAISRVVYPTNLDAALAELHALALKGG